MYKENRDYAERVLKHLCIGARMDGIRFGLSNQTTQFYLTSYEGIDNYEGQLYLNVESKWTIFESTPSYFPKNESEMAEVTEEEAYHQIFKIRRQKIIDIKLGNDSPHLIISLESGSTLFVNGYHEKFECWQVGVNSDSD